MKTIKSYFPIVTGCLVLIAIFGLFEHRSYEFVSSVSEKNLKLLEVVSEVKLALSGIGKINIPFISGGSSEISSDLSRVQNYLLIVNVISLLQLMLLAVSKSWIIKTLLLVLFVLCLFRKTKLFFSGILILALALVPGLSIYTVAIESLSKEASIDFGGEYLKQLEVSKQAVKSEKAQMMKEHAKKMNQINNGEHGIILFRKLKEDVSYDLEVAKTDIHGDYAHIRLLLHDAGKEMVRKILIFCTMVLFCLFIMPMGYALIIYLLYKRLAIAGHFYSDNHIQSGMVGTEEKNLSTQISGVSNKVRKIASAVKSAAADDVQKLVQFGDKVGQAEETLKNENLKKEAENIIGDVKHEAENIAAEITDKVKEEEDKKDTDKGSTQGRSFISV